MNILIADDEATLRLVMAATLKKLGHEVTKVATGLQAWQALQQDYFPVLVTDWTMPEMDGMHLTQMLRATTPHDLYTYVVMVTAHGSREDYLNGIRAGVDAFLVKPFDEALLEAQLFIGERIAGLQNHTKRLESIMTVCSYCKRVRSEDDRWVGMEKYLDTTFQTKPSHTVCASCFTTKVKPEMERLGINGDHIQVR